jgi:hypothetical protein
MVHNVPSVWSHLNTMSVIGLGPDECYAPMNTLKMAQYIAPHEVGAATVSQAWCRTYDQFCVDSLPRHSNASTASCGPERSVTGTIESTPMITRWRRKQDSLYQKRGVTLLVVTHAKQGHYQHDECGDQHRNCAVERNDAHETERVGVQ